MPRQLGGLLCAGLAAGSTGNAAAQEIQLYEFTPLPAGTNVLLGYYSYGHDTLFNVAAGPTLRNSKLETNFFNLRYVHFFNELASTTWALSSLQASRHVLMDGVGWGADRRARWFA